eukprot:SAG31_NODE_4532_length_3158_cov_3.684679_2_plen_186_part_00
MTAVRELSSSILLKFTNSEQHISLGAVGVAAADRARRLANYYAANGAQVTAASPVKNRASPRRGRSPEIMARHSSQATSVRSPPRWTVDSLQHSRKTLPGGGIHAKSYSQMNSMMASMSYRSFIGPFTADFLMPPGRQGIGIATILLIPLPLLVICIHSEASAVLTRSTIIEVLPLLLMMQGCLK